MKQTIGQQLCAVVLSHRLGISMQRAFQVYVRGREIDSSWDKLGELLLTTSITSDSGSAAPNLSSRAGSDPP